MGAAPSTQSTQSPPSSRSVPQTKTFVAYHGTSWENAKSIAKSGHFHESADGQLGRGVYVGREEKARGYALKAPERQGGNDGVLIKCEVTVENPKFVKGTVKSHEHPGHDAVRSDFTNLSRAPEWVIRDAKKVKPIDMTLVKTHKSKPGKPCAGGCGYLANDHPAYHNVKPLYTDYCCEACAKGLGFHGGWCQKKKV